MPSIGPPELVYVYAAVPQSVEAKVKAMAAKYSNVLYLPTNSHATPRDEMANKIEWERKILALFDSLPEMHPALEYEADTNPYSRSTTKEDGSENNFTWNMSKFASPAEVQQEVARLQSLPCWGVCYVVIEGRECEDERASIDAVLRPVAEFEKEKRRKGEKGKLFEFRYHKSPDEAITDVEELEETITGALEAVKQAKADSDHAVVREVQQALAGSGMLLDTARMEARLILPGEDPSKPIARKLAARFEVPAPRTPPKNNDDVARAIAEAASSTKPAIGVPELWHVYASVPQSAEEEVEALAKKYRNVLYVPVHIHGTPRDMMEWKIEWERKILALFDSLPDMHPALEYEADVNPYSRSTTKDDGSENNFTWDMGKFAPKAEAQKEAARLRSLPCWGLCYIVIEGGGKGCAAERASLKSVLIPVAKAEKAKRKRGQPGKLFEFRYHKSAESAINDITEMDESMQQAMAAVDQAAGDEAQLEAIIEALAGSGLRIDMDKREGRLVLPA